MKNNILFGLFLFFLVACNNLPLELKSRVTKELQKALNEAGSNRPELEKVLIHYCKNPQDSLKFKAACFLIQNMKGYYSVTGKNVDKLEELYRIIGNVSTDERNEIYKRGVDSMKIEYSFDKKFDIEHISAKYLIQNIEQSYKTWVGTPWHTKYSFDLFCEYVLPRIYDEKLTMWRPVIEKIFQNQLKKIYFENGILYEAENAKYRNSLIEEKNSASNYKTVTITVNEKINFEKIHTETGEKILFIQHYNGGNNAKVNVIINDVDTIPVVLKYTGGWLKPAFSVVKVPITVKKNINKICLECKSGKVSIDYISVVPILDFEPFKHSGIVSGATYKITNKQNSKSLAIDGDSAIWGSKVITSNYKGKNIQKFILSYTDYGFYKIKTPAKQKTVLDLPYGKIENGIEMDISFDFNVLNQLWTLVATKDKGYYRIVNKKSGKCLEINSVFSKNRIQVVQNEYRDNDSQLWKFEMVEKAPILDTLTELKSGTTLEASDRIFHETLDFQIYQLSGYMPSINAVDLIHTKIGSCHEEAQYLTYISRGLGIPMTYDFTPQWPNRSLSHYWNVLIDENGKSIKYYFRNKPGTYTIFDDWPKGKVFRSTFSINQQSLAFLNSNREEIPKLFENMHFIDVTEQYTKTSNIKVILDPKKCKKRKFAYLSVFDNKNWVPISWGKIQSNSVVFNKMGHNVVYLPIFYNCKENVPAGTPFLLSKSGKISVLKPDTNKLQKMVLYRKYPYIFYYSPNDKMVGGRFQGSNDPEFNNVIDLYRFNSITNGSFCNLEISNKRTFRYLRYIGADGKYCNINEIIFYDGNGKEINGDIIGTSGSFNDNGSTKEKVFDKNVITGFDAPRPNGGWVGLKLKKPTRVSMIRFMPRTDGNIVEQSDEYELVYWNNGWKSCGIKTAVTDSLIFNNIPRGALYLLHDRSKGNEERIFTYENGKQVWW